jgi:hypothetical protein
MTTPNGSEIFYRGIPVFRGFARLMDPALYSPLPDDWTIGVADIAESIKAIAQARSAFDEGPGFAAAERADAALDF